MHLINTIGVATLCKREIWRFMKVWNQTLIAPIVTTLLFLAVLMLAMGGNVRIIDEIPYGQFIAPGLVMMAIMQNAFANTASSLTLSKVQGYIIDILMPPLTGAELTFCLIVGGIARGILVGIAVMLAVYFFVPFPISHPLTCLFYAVSASIMLSTLGIITGIWGQSFDQLSAITNYVITPLSFLSGTFYSIKQLPEFWHIVCHFNPFFYLIDGFRYSTIGYTDGTIVTGMIVITAANIALITTSVILFNKGYRLKS